MIKFNDIVVNSNFDSGVFKNSFTVCKSMDIPYENTNIQDVYRLNNKDFVKLETLIAVVVDSYIKNKDKHDEL